MTEKAEDKVETLPDLDDLLQCPVCYEIPSGQIFQCNEGHHVCGRCKMRLDVCPVCRAFFFGTRNYAMEELISNVKKLRAFKLGGKVTTDTVPAEVAEAVESSSEEETTHENAVQNDDASSGVSGRPPAACSGLFRCLSCKNNPERLPLARLLNHLRYYHSPDLIEGRSEEGGYLQAWQFPTAPGRMVTAVRVHDMGIFFLVIEISHEAVYAWLSMAAAPWVAQNFTYTLTLSGNDREAIFTDCVWSVRSCEGTLKKRGRCLTVSGADRSALLTSPAMSGKLSVRSTPTGAHPHLTEPRAVLRVANRSHAPAADVPQDLEPFLLGLQNDVARLSQAFASLGREANALVRSEAEMRARLVNVPENLASAAEPAVSPSPAERAAISPSPAVPQPAPENGGGRMSRNARRRMRHRLRDLFQDVLVIEPNTGSAERQSSVAVTPAPLVAATPRYPPPTAASRRPVPPAAVTPRSAPALERNAINITRSNTIQTSNVPNQQIRSNSNQNVNRPQNNPVNGNNGARISNRGNIATSDGAARPTGPNQNLAPARANNSNQNSSFGGRSAHGQTPVVHTMNNMRVVSPEEQQAPSITFGGPSQGRTPNGNTRNKKKHRQQR